MCPIEGLRDELPREPIDPGRNRCMRREDRPRTNRLKRLIKRQALMRNEFSDPLDTEKTSMTLVGGNTSGSGCAVSRQKARTARTPPTPRRSSWRNRCSLVPHTNGRSHRAWSARFAQHRYQATAGELGPCATRTSAVRSPSGSDSSTRTTEPSASRSSVSGRPSGSSTGYVSCCHPSGTTTAGSIRIGRTTHR